MSSAVHEIALDREIAGTLCGEGRGLFTAARLAPTFSQPRPDDGGTVPDAPPFSVPFVERLERGHEEASTASRAALDIERLKLPGGRLEWSVARELVRVFRRFLEFPVADLMISRRIPSGGLVVIDQVPGEEHLHFTVTQTPGLSAASPWEHTAREVAVQWGGLAPAD